MEAVLYVIIAVVILIGLLMYMIAPNRRRDCSKFEGKMFAHRGLHEPGVPENSLEAFRRAKEAGYGVELDVQYTSDEKIVVFHDGNLKRMCGIDKNVRDCTYEELRGYRLEDSDESIPLFTQVLELLDGMTIVCEIKNHNGNVNDKLCKETYEYLEDYKGEYCIESFSPMLVNWFRVHAPQVIRGQLSCNMAKEQMSPLVKFMMTHLLVNVMSRPDFIAYRHQDMNMLGYKLCTTLFNPFKVAWTARGVKEQESAWKKADSVIFELYENDHPVE